MSETATAEAAYYEHTLTHRPLDPVSRYTPHPGLAQITSKLLTLPAEIRARIYHHAFQGNRVAVTSVRGCYCGSVATGPYRDDLNWMLKLPRWGELSYEVRRAFIGEALWEIHCEKAFEAFVARFRYLSNGNDALLRQVRHIKVNVFEIIRESWLVETNVFGPALRSITFGPWQKGWTIDVPNAVESPDELSDEKLMVRVTHAINTKHGYGFLKEAWEKGRVQRGGWKALFLFPIRYHVKQKDGKKRWQMQTWRADLDEGVIEKDWKDVHLVQEATLD
ncbi:uncharacterized protein AB675_9560 [Cyphellophora attinorum]|uniref:Uncharacterized protein n=1 Tax=Cyphellophora attinorum TaxID=1664694 RepID=A0A0N1P0J7_9EURO|nr:uncharacterized protein AB675_9560 [Phialophora attinorum]KPI42354.1 hypothetical protein AB675_9560 [Phialophora attinorum]